MSLLSMAESVFVPISPQIQVTLNCNFQCGYCFQDHRSKAVMDVATAAAILEKCAEYNGSWVRGYGRGEVEVFWHGGEPLLAGMDFYLEMLNIQSKIPGVTFKNHLQTNGALLTDAYARFLIENSFQLGFSLDGPKAINDLHRRTVGRRDSAFDAAVRGIENYRRHLPPGARAPIIAVITRDSIDRAEALFSFFKEFEAEVQLDMYDLRCDDLSAADKDDLFRLAPDKDQIQQFLIKLFDLWFYDTDRKVDFKELRDDLDLILREEACLQTPFHKRRCSHGRTIFNPQGLVFACDQYVNDAATALGDIRRDALSTIMRKKAALWDAIKNTIRKSPDHMACSKCDWGTSCMGGCITCMKYNSMLLRARAQGLPDDQWREAPMAPSLRDVVGETYYCEALRGLRRHIQDAVKRELGGSHA
ncbi:MAG: radical SAM protein [Solidesulfovibrio sp.]